MKSIPYRRIVSASVVAALLFLMAAAPDAQTTRSRPPLRNTGEPRYAYEHGYRAGYEDGFEQGRKDFQNSRTRAFTQSEEYRRADRTFEDRMGAFSEYQDGYRIGFELAYNDGYFGRPYSVSIPSNMAQVITANASDRSASDRSASRRYPSDQPSSNQDRTYPRDRDTTDRDRYGDRSAERGSSGIGSGNSGGVIDRSRSGRDVMIPDGEELRISLTSPVSTKTNREGDRFSARVVLPRDYMDATITGHIAQVNRSGRATGKTELSLAFDEIVMPDGRRGVLDAQVVRVFEGETVKTVDEEGNVQTGSRTKDTATRGVGGAAVGAVIGAIAGGGKGAAIGAIIGGAVGAGSVYVQGNKDLILDTGTEMVIRVNQRSQR